MIIGCLMWWKPSEDKACKTGSLIKQCKYHFAFKKKKSNWKSETVSTKTGHNKTDSDASTACG